MKLPSPIIQCHHHGINNRIALFVIDTQFRHLSLEVPVFVWGASPAFADSLRSRALVNRARTRSRPFGL